MNGHSFKNKTTIMRSFLLGWIFMSLSLAAQESPEMLFLTARYAETVTGDLQEALRLYERILDRPDTGTGMAARVLLRIGGCFEKMGEERAWEMYERILRDYPEQTETAALARSRLAAHDADREQNHPLVSYYFQRTGIDPYTSISYDGKMKAFTDWTTGNLVIRDLSTDETQSLTDTDWGRSESYALHPAWSRDGRFIAYAWQTGFFSSELHVVDLEEGGDQMLWKSSECLIVPQDWSPGSELISVETYNPWRDPAKRLGLFNMPDQRMTEPLSLDENSRGFRFSPDGRWIAFDWNETGNRHIYLYAHSTNQLVCLTRGGIGPMGYDNPVWGPDGGRILCRSLRSTRFDLWELETGGPSRIFSPRLVQEDLTNTLIRMKSIDHYAAESGIRELSMNDETAAPVSFSYDFEAAALDSPWFVRQWTGPNVYDYPAFGRYSLKDSPGFLRYYLDPMMFPRITQAYLPRFSGWYWYYPSLEIGTLLAGDRWELEARVRYHMRDGANSQNIYLIFSFDPGGQDESILTMNRNTNILPVSRLSVSFSQPGVESTSWKMDFSLPDEIQRGEGPFLFRILRDQRRIRVYFREEKVENHYSLILECELSPSIQSRIQRFFITGESWFVPAGAYADFDYIRFRPLKPEESMDGVFFNE